MLLRILFFVLVLDYLVVDFGANAFLRNDITDDYIQKYLDKVYLERDLVYSEQSLDGANIENVFKESGLKSSILKTHRNQALNYLGGVERLIDLMELLKSDAQEEDEDSIDEGVELMDHFDKAILSSNLDSNYYHYISEIEGDGFGKLDDFGTHRLRVSFGEDRIKSDILKRMKSGIKVYEFRSKVEKVLDLEHKTREFEDKEDQRRVENGFIRYSSGYYLIKRSKGDDVKYSIKIESPMEMIDFKELVLLDEINILYRKKSLSEQFTQDIQSYHSGGEYIYEKESGYVMDDDEYMDEEYEELEEDYGSRVEYQSMKAAKHLLTRGYPVCELKCVIKDLQSKVQWTKKVARFLDKNAEEEGSVVYNKINASNWCDRLVFHNCMGFELESMEVSIMNQKLREKVNLIENTLDSEANDQIERYFNNVFKDQPRRVFKTGQIGKIIVLNEILESSGFVISINKKNRDELLMRYEKISKFSQNLVSLKQVLGSTKYKFMISGFSRGYTVLNSLYRFSTKKEGLLVNTIKPITRQTYVLDIEQVMVFMQNILLILKYEKANNKNGVFLPWYSRSTKDPLTKQNNFINSLLSEYLTLLRLFNRQKFYSKDRFYRFNTFNIYSLISHYKSFETGSYENRFGEMVRSSDVRVFVVNTNLAYYDQARINRIFRGKSSHSMSYFEVSTKITNSNIGDFKYLREHFTPLITEMEHDNSGEYEDYFHLIERKNIENVSYGTGKDTAVVIEIPKPIKKSTEIKGNIEFDSNDLVFQNNLCNFGFNIAFINYIYQSSLNLDDAIISSPPWWMVWQSQFYPRLSLERSIKELDLNSAEDPEEFAKEMNSTWLELPVNSESSNSFLDLGSFIPKEIISKEILESVIMEEVELVNPTSMQKGDLVHGKNKENNPWDIIKEKQQSYINKWKKIDVINDPNNLFFYNLFTKKQSLPFSNSNLGNYTKFYFNPCIINIFNEINDSEWLANCNSKWKIYSVLFDRFNSTINHYLSITTFLDLLNEMKILLIIQSQVK